MDDGYSPVSILVLIGFILLEAVFYGFGSAIQNVNEGKLEEEARQGNRKAARLLEIVNRPGRFVHTIQITTHLIGMITGAVILPVLVNGLMRHVHIFKPMAGWYAGTSGGPWYLDSMWWEQILFMAAVTIALLLIIISFGIIIPKRLAAKEPEKWGYHMLPVVLFAAGVFLPLTKLITLVSALVLRLFGVDLADDDDNVTEEDIMSMVNEGHEQGVIQASEAEMITNIFEFGDKRAEDIMTNRTNIVAIDCEMTFGDAIQFMLNGRNSRYPVYEENIDHIIGILHMKDALRRQSATDPGMKVRDIPGLLRDARFIPETRKVDSLFKTMQSTKCQMVIVLDEYGQTAGMIAMEDILEEIVGNILDEYDVDESYIREKSKDEYIIEGKTPLEELEELFDISFDESEFETLNGFLIAKLEHIPEPDEQFDIRIDGYDFKVLSVENKMIKTVLVKKLPEESGAACEERPLSGKTEEDRRSSGQDKAGESGNK